RGGIRGRRSSGEHLENHGEQTAGGQKTADRNRSHQDPTGDGREPRHPVSPAGAGGHAPHSEGPLPLPLRGHACHVTSLKSRPARRAPAARNPSTLRHPTSTQGRRKHFSPELQQPANPPHPNHPKPPPHPPRSS